MPLQRGQLVLIDTNVIIEAHDTNCLAQIAESFRLCTVEQVIAETQRGRQRRRPERNIDEDWLRRRMEVIGDVTDEERFEFTMKYQAVGLDDGERDLLIFATGLQDAWFLNSPDMAVLRFAHQAGCLQRLVSLEEMCRTTNARLRQNLRDNFRESWLAVNRTELSLGVLR